jgi:hypothetical protein
MALIHYDATTDRGGTSLLDTLRGYFVRYRLALYSLLGSSRCFRCCPELELANGRRVISRRGSPTVRVDDVQVHETRDSQVR